MNASLFLKQLEDALKQNAETLLTLDANNAAVIGRAQGEHRGLMKAKELFIKATKNQLDDDE